MDRIQPLRPSEGQSVSRPDIRVESGLFSEPTEAGDLATFAPLHYEPGYAYPLIVWLHGRGADERQLLRIMPLISMRNYAAVAPRGLQLDQAGKSGVGWDQSQRSIRYAQQQVFDAIDKMSEQFNVNPRRIFLGGFDCGGTMAFRVALSHPYQFAGVLSLGGDFPHGQTPLGNLVEARKLPILLAVGRDSTEYPPDRVCENLRLFHTAGLSTTLRQYPCGHELSPQMLGDVDRWIIEVIGSAGNPDQRTDLD